MMKLNEYMDNMKWTGDVNVDTFDITKIIVRN